MFMSIKKECGNCLYSDVFPGMEPCGECQGTNSHWQPKATLKGKTANYIVLDEVSPPDMQEPKGEPELPNSHYQTDIQPLEAMQANMSQEAFCGYLRGNIIKYSCRIGKKDEELKEAKKIADYARWLVLAVQGIKINPRKD